MFYFGLKYTARIQGSTAVAVRCEKCFQKYYYQLVCTAVGHDSAPYGIGIETAKKRARQNAKRKLRRMLESGHAAVPCPQCGTYQPHMIPLLKAPRLHWLRYVGVRSVVVGAVIGGFAAMGTYAAANPESKTDMVPALMLWALAAIAVLVGLALFLIRSISNAKFDPNDPEKEAERLNYAREHTISREQAEYLMAQQEE